MDRHTSRSRFSTTALVAHATIAFALASAAAGLAFLVFGVWARPYTEIEAQLVYEAHRIREHLPLYADPVAGAWEDGAPPSHFHVLYPPAWVYVLASFPAATLEGTRCAGRIASVLLYVGALAAIVRGARPENKRATFVGALAVLGLELVTREAGLSQTDVPAVALVTFAFLRTARRARLDGLSAALFAAAPLVKHSVVGAALGALVAHVVAERRNGARALLGPLAGGAVVAAVLIAAYQRVSGGAWIVHILHATGQSLSFERWEHELGSRFVLLGAPHLAVLALAIHRRAPLRLTAPLALSLAWTVVALAKHGSATHYWLEPTMAALVVVSHLPQPRVAPTARAAFAFRLAGLALVASVAASSIPSFARAPDAYASWGRSLRSVEARCPRAPGDVVMSSDVRMEVALDRRPIIPAWETSYMVRSGTFPLETWRAEVERPQVKCLVVGAGYYAPPPKGDAAGDVSVYGAELRGTIDTLFLPGSPAGDFLLLVRR
jgi:hypothetical protein